MKLIWFICLFVFHCMAQSATDIQTALDAIGNVIKNNGFGDCVAPQWPQTSDGEITPSSDCGNTFQVEQGVVEGSGEKYLKGLKIEYSNLPSIPSEISLLTGLESLRVSSSHLTIIPSELTYLAQLTSLYVYGNSLGEFPTIVYDLPALEYLSLNTNQIREIPTDIALLTGLTYLGLGGNYLLTLPTELFTFPADAVGLGYNFINPDLHNDYFEYINHNSCSDYYNDYCTNNQGPCVWKNGVCKADCPDQYYSNDDGTCSARTVTNVVGCKTYSDVADACEICESGKYLATDGKSCPQCPTGKYCDGTTEMGDITERDNCDAYSTSVDECAECNGGFMPHKSGCFACPGKSFSDGKGDCQVVAEVVGCSTYSNVDGTCTACITGYTKVGATCVKDPENCKTVDANNKCVQCKDKFGLDGGVCRVCVDNEYVNGDGECVAYPSGCVQVDTEEACVKCAEGYGLTSSGCVPYPDNCETVGTDGACTKCVAGHGFVQGTTQCEECSGTQYVDQQTLSCTSIPNCVAGKTGSSEPECTQCNGGYMPFNGKCSKCSGMGFSDGTMPCQTAVAIEGCLAYSNVDGSCTQTPAPEPVKPANCATVNENNVCVKCEENHALADGQCTQCGSGKYSDGSGECVDVPANCKTVAMDGVCTRCEKGYGHDGKGKCKLCGGTDTWSDGYTCPEDPNAVDDNESGNERAVIVLLALLLFIGVVCVIIVLVSILSKKPASKDVEMSIVTPQQTPVVSAPAAPAAVESKEQSSSSSESVSEEKVSDKASHSSKESSSSSEASDNSSSSDSE